MYCPNCSQQQVDEVRFCSRCGFQLGVVKALLADDSNAAAIPEIKPSAKLLSSRQRDILFGATFMFIAAAAIVLLSWVMPKDPIIFPLLVVWIAFTLFVLFFNPLMRAAYKLFSEESAPTPIKDVISSPAASRQVRKVSPASQVALPPTQSVPVTAMGTQRVQTAEIVQPPSVTEHTTNLLEKDRRK